jgi:hypothetical protein
MTEGLTFKTNVDVFLDGKKIGTIKEVKDGFQFYPNGQKIGGAVFPTLQACKNSL